MCSEPLLQLAPEASANTVPMAIGTNRNFVKNKAAFNPYLLQAGLSSFVLVKSLYVIVFAISVQRF
jgi:hypothetical protein